MLKDICDQLHYIPQAFILTIMFSLIYLYIVEHKKDTVNKIKELLHNNIWIVLFLFYSALLFTGTVMARYSTYPFADMIGIISFYQNGRINAGGLINIAIFIPYTILYIKAFSPKKVMLTCFQIAISTTGFIELFQLLFWLGQFSVADIIHNTLGGIIGGILWCTLKALVNRRKRIKS